MALKLPLLTYLLFYTALNTYSQEQAYTVTNSEFLKLIRDSLFVGCQFVTFPEPNAKEILDFRSTRVGNNGQCPLIANGEIFIQIPSTGIVYKCTGSKQADSVKFVRIDNTEHVGYNINNFSFVHRNSFSSLKAFA